MRQDKRILVIDDDDAIRALLATVLRRRGYVVDLARNGEEGLECIAKARYSLVILDMRMPRVSGYEVLEQLGHASVFSRPRVLVLTGNGPEARGFEPTLVVGSMQKPFNVELLVDVVRGYLTDLPTPATEQAVDEVRPN